MGFENQRGCGDTPAGFLLAVMAAVRLSGRAHLARHSTEVGKSKLGALLREREVTGRDASLPAPFVDFSF